MKVLLRAALLLSASVWAASALAQAYPSKPVRIIVPFAPGGAADLMPRIVGQKLSEMWGQPVLVENRTGAAGNIGMEAVAKSPPDGYTLVSAPNGNLVVNPHLYANLPYDVFRDFTPLTLVMSVQNVLVVHPSVPARTAADYVELARQKPGTLTYASGGSGAQSHMAGELMKAMTGVDLVHVPYQGVGPAMKDVLGGQVASMFTQMPAALPQVKAGKLRALGVASLVRSPLMPDVPTIAEDAKLPGFEAVSWYALVGPAGMSKEVVAKLHGDIGRVLAMPDVRQRLADMGAEPVGSTPEQLTEQMRRESPRWGELIRRAGIKPN
jgi:tripartite-type tricarboxylate transporter receptor subunit TctC